jgi:hypothetical protein
MKEPDEPLTAARFLCHPNNSIRVMWARATGLAY